MKLENITIWLRKMEELACSVYAEAAAMDVCPDNLAAFLRQLSKDEALHYHLMGSASEFLRSQDKSLQSDILIDQATKERIEAPLHRIRNAIEQNQLSEQMIVEGIVESETSEWNNLFLYAVNICAELSPAFQHMAASIQAHEKRIERFFADAGAYPDFACKLATLPEIWKKRILVVDDEPALRSLYVRALGKYGEVLAVENGEMALDAIRKNYFDVVVTDVDMPERDGVSLLREAVRNNDLWRSHFIVCTGNASAEVHQVTAEYSVPLLKKPMPLKLLWETVESVLLKLNPDSPV